MIRLLHLHLDLPNPLQNNFHVSSTLKAVKRTKAKEVCYKMTLSCENLRAMKSHLNLDLAQDAQLWSLILTCFYGLLRISNVTVPNPDSWDPVKIIARQDITISPEGCVMGIRWAKNLQLRDRILHVALPRLNNDLCPTFALLNMLRLAGPVPPAAPAWSLCPPQGPLTAPTPAWVRLRLQRLIAAIGLPPSEYNTHSLRRSGASHLLSSGVPCEVIKVLGDWKSDAVFRYLKPQPQQRLHMANQAFS